MPVIDVSGADFGPDVSQLPSGGLRFAANATLEALRCDPLVASRLAALSDLLALVGASGVRNLATLGGNLAWGSGDTEVLLAALRAEYVLAGGGRCPVGLRLPADSLVVAVEVPASGARDVFVEKVGHRASFSPSKLVVAGARCESGWRIAARLGPTPVTCRTIEAGPTAELAFPASQPRLARIAENLVRGHVLRLGAAA